MEINFTSGTSTATTASVSLPSGLSIDTSKLDTSGSNIFGFGIVSSAAAVTWCLIAANTGGTVLYFSQQSASNAGTGPLNGSSYLSSGQSAHFIVRNVPIQGWSSSVQMSDGYDGRQIAFMAEGAVSSSVGSNTLIGYSSIVKDDVNGWNSTNKEWEVPASGDYEIEVQHGIVTLGTAAVNQYAGALIHIDGGLVRQKYKYVENTGVQTWYISTSYSGPLTAGQKIKIYVDTNITSPTLTTGSSQTFVKIIKYANPQTMSATAKHTCSYQLAGGQTLTATGIIKFDTKLTDSYGSYDTSTGIFKPFEAGTYEISNQMFSINATTQADIRLRKNSVAIARHAVTPVYSAGTSIANNNSYMILTPIQVDLTSEDTLDLYNSSALGTGSIYNSAIDNILTIKKIK